MLIMTKGDNKMNMKRDNVRIVRIILDLHDEIVDSRKVVLRTLFSLNMKRFFYRELENGRNNGNNLMNIRHDYVQNSVSFPTCV